jgi:hypothetical protein
MHQLQRLGYNEEAATTFASMSNALTWPWKSYTLAQKNAPVAALLPRAFNDLHDVS